MVVSLEIPGVKPIECAASTEINRAIFKLQTLIADQKLAIRSICRFKLLNINFVCLLTSFYELKPYAHLSAA